MGSGSRRDMSGCREEVFCGVCARYGMPLERRVDGETRLQTVYCAFLGVVSGDGGGGARAPRVQARGRRSDGVRTMAG